MYFFFPLQMQMLYEIEPRAFLNVQNVIQNIVYYFSVWALQSASQAAL